MIVAFLQGIVDTCTVGLVVLLAMWWYTEPRTTDWKVD